MSKIILEENRQTMICYLGTFNWNMEMLKTKSYEEVEKLYLEMNPPKGLLTQQRELPSDVKVEKFEIQGKEVIIESYDVDINTVVNKEAIPSDVEGLLRLVDTDYITKLFKEYFMKQQRGTDDFKLLPIEYRFMLDYFIKVDQLKATFTSMHQELKDSKYLSQELALDIEEWEKDYAKLQSKLDDIVEVVNKSDYGNECDDALCPNEDKLEKIKQITGR